MYERPSEHLSGQMCLIFLNLCKNGGVECVTITVLGLADFGMTCPTVIMDIKGNCFTVYIRSLYVYITVLCCNCISYTVRSQICLFFMNRIFFVNH